MVVDSRPICQRSKTVVPEISLVGEVVHFFLNEIVALGLEGSSLVCDGGESELEVI